MRHLVLLSLVLVATASLATSAQASPSAAAGGVVLSVSSTKHTLRIVEGRRVVDATYQETLPSGVTPGAEIGFTTARRRVLHVAVLGRVDHVLLSGVVVRAGKRLALRLSDSSLFPLPKTRHLRVGAPAHQVVRFSSPAAKTSPSTSPSRPPATPGTSTSPSVPAAHGCARPDCTFDVTGTVSAVDDATGAVAVNALTGGVTLTAEAGDVDTGDVFVGDFLHITGTQSAATGTYTLKSLDELPGCDTPDCKVEFDATVSEIDGTTIVVSDDDGDEYPLTASAAQLSTIREDDDVHIVAMQDPLTGDYRVLTITVTAGPSQ